MRASTVLVGLSASCAAFRFCVVYLGTLVAECSSLWIASKSGLFSFSPGTGFAVTGIAAFVCGATLGLPTRRAATTLAILSIGGWVLGVPLVALAEWIVIPQDYSVLFVAGYVAGWTVIIPIIAGGLILAQFGRLAWRTARNRTS